MISDSKLFWSLIGRLFLDNAPSCVKVRYEPGSCRALLLNQ